MANSRSISRFMLLVLAALVSVAPVSAAPLRVLFLGDRGHHQPAERFKQLQPYLAGKGIEITYTDLTQDLNPARLAGFNALVIFANHTQISPDEEKALLDYVASGKGLVPLHCASYCFLNSPRYIALVGGQFKSHGTGTFKETWIRPTHPVLQGLQPIESWDETYVHTQHNDDRLVLSERLDDKGREPYTWVRQHGKGRVFYTAWGHDERTWGQPQFLALVENGIRWAAGAGEGWASLDLKPNPNLAPLPYTNAPGKIPNYVPGKNWGTMGQAINQMQMPLDPKESAKHVALPPGFKAELWAADPEIVKPICMAWDAHGRLWIAETIDYPNEQQKQGEGRDRIKICEDTDGDGKADKFTVFADKLSIPTGMAFARGGLIVIEGGHTLFLKDNNGDDVADERTVLFTGWNMGDTHATASNLRYGFDNWIWGTVGYSGFDGEVGGKRVRFSMGVYRFKSDGSALEFIRSSDNNTWGLGLSEDGIVFGSTANNNASWYMPIPNRFYEAVSGWSSSRMETIADSQRFYPITDKVRQVDAHGKYTAGAGHALYTARSFPKEYWNRIAFVAEPTGHLVGKFRLDSQGADFAARNEHSFLASDDEWTAPIMAEVGPDGALWVLDWCNYIVQHNPTPEGFKTGRGNAYETPLRDKRHGRIYRASYVAGKPTPPTDLRKASPETLVATLSNENQLWRMHAQRLLVERGNQDVVPSLLKLVADQSVDEIGLNVGAIHALWTLQALEASSVSGPTRETMLAALKHPSPGVRRAAVAVLPRDASTLALLLSGKLHLDSDPQVRLATFLAFAELPSSDTVGTAALEFLRDERASKDKWLSHAAISAAAHHDAAFLKAVLATVTSAPTPVKKTAPTNVLPNPSFENERDGKPIDWNETTHGGRATFSLAEEGHSGGRSVKIASERGADASWSHRVAVVPNMNYRLSAWIKTAQVTGAMGALLNVHELQGETTVRTKAVQGSSDWTRVEARFNSGEHQHLTINCLFGGWGASRGAAWFDDVELVPTGVDTTLPGALGMAVKLVTGHYAQRGPVDSVLPTLLSIKGASPGLAVAFLDGLAQGWPTGKVPQLATEDESRLVNLMGSLSSEAKSSLLTLAEHWGITRLFTQQIAELGKDLQTQLADANLSDDQRVDSAKRWVTLDDSIATTRAIVKQINSLSSPNLVNGLIGAVGEGRQAASGDELIALLTKLTPTARRTATATLLRRADWAKALLGAVEAKSLQRADIAADHWSQLKNHPDKSVAAKAAELSTAAGTASNPDMEAIVKKLLPIADQHGDPKRGKEIFTTTCAICHTFEGLGAKIGPELTGVGARPRKDILVDILDPNRSVEANFRLWNVTLKSGDTYSGRLDSESATAIEILDTAGQKHTVQRKEIAELNASNQSLMPAGFDALPASDLASLLDYLTEHGHDAKK